MTHILIPREPSTALLRPFIGCNTQQLHEAWAAMVRIAEVQHARSGSQCQQQIEEPTTLAGTTIEQYARMFDAACVALGQVSDCLGINSDINPGAEPIIAAIEQLRAGKTHPVLDDRWKARMLDGRAMERDEMGLGDHPELPWLDEGMMPRSFYAALGLELVHTMAEDQLDGDALEAMSEAVNWTGWTPTPPPGDGWKLVSIFDTEDGPAAWWLRELPEAEDGTTTIRNLKAEVEKLEARIARAGAAPAAVAHLPAVLEQIAQGWDGCMYDAPGETLDIGADIRAAAKRLLAEQPAVAARPAREEIAALREEHGITSTGRGIKEFEQVDAFVRAVLQRWGAAPALEAPAAPAAPWCPDVCPITGRPFFMWIDHWQTGKPVPTYGGPYDSYTIPVKDSDGSFECERYDHDEGGWLTEGAGWHCLGVKLVNDQSFVVDPSNPRYNEIEAFAAAAPQAPAEVVGWVHPQWAAEQGRGRIYGHNPGGYIAVQIAAPQAPAAPSGDERAAYVEFLAGKFPQTYSKEDAEHWWDHGHVSALTWQAARADAAAPAAPAVDAAKELDPGLSREVYRACEDLPEGWSIRIDLENGYGGVVLIGPDGEEDELPVDGMLSDAMRASIAAAQAAAKGA